MICRIYWSERLIIAPCPSVRSTTCNSLFLLQTSLQWVVLCSLVFHFRPAVALKKQLSQSPPEPYTPPSVTTDTKTLSIFMEYTWQTALDCGCAPIIPSFPIVNRLQMIEKDIMGLQSRQQWGPELHAWHATGSRLHTPTVVKKNSDLLEMYWGRRSSLSISRFISPQFVKGNTVIWLAACQVLQVRLLGLSAPLVYASVFLSPKWPLEKKGRKYFTSRRE